MLCCVTSSNSAQQLFCELAGAVVGAASPAPATRLVCPVPPPRGPLTALMTTFHMRIDRKHTTYIVEGAIAAGIANPVRNAIVCPQANSCPH